MELASGTSWQVHRTTGMSRTNVLQHLVWPRAARLLATVLLLGGIGAGPLTHLATDAGIVAGPTCEASHEHDGSEQVPETHHDCPVCITLATATPSVLTAIPVARLADAQVMAAIGSTMGDGPASDLSRARAPPIA
jgi:hypothetical protein